MSNGTDYINHILVDLRAAYDKLLPGTEMPDSLQTDRAQSSIREAQHDIHAAVLHLTDVMIALHKEERE